MSGPEAESQTTSLLPVAVAAWLAYLVIDFLTHAVFLAPWWQGTESYWLPPAALFRMIPFAYLAFAIYATGLVWLMVRVGGPRPTLAMSLRIGAVVGLAFGSTSALANYSVFPMPTSMLLVWPVSVTIASLGASAAGSWTLWGPRPWRRVLAVFLASLMLFAVGVVLQNLLVSASATRISR